MGAFLLFVSSLLWNCTEMNMLVNYR